MDIRQGLMALLRFCDVHHIWKDVLWGVLLVIWMACCSRAAKIDLRFRGSQYAGNKGLVAELQMPT